jgi:hypothetical protein
MAGAPTNEKAKRRADQALLATYHEARLADLLEHVREGFNRYEAGEIDVFGLDGLIHHYQLAAKELWKFCSVSGVHVEIAVRTLELWKERGETPDWWQDAVRTRGEQAHHPTTSTRASQRVAFAPRNMDLGAG